jgi:hypothetical protein
LAAQETAGKPAESQPTAHVIAMPAAAKSAGDTVSAAAGMGYRRDVARRRQAEEKQLRNREKIN